MIELRRTTLLDSAVQVLNHAFSNGELESAEHLSESHVSKRLWVIRTMVREALRHLEQEGWVTRIPYKGTFVRWWNEKGF